MNDIGYRKPPPEKRFKAGVSGNPKGRPKGSKNFLTLLEKELAQPITVNENGRKKTITRLQAMVKKMVASALQGDQKSILTLIETMRRSGLLEKVDVDSLVPDNYASILDSYVQRRQKSSVMASPESEQGLP